MGSYLSIAEGFLASKRITVNPGASLSLQTQIQNGTLIVVSGIAKIG